MKTRKTWLTLVLALVCAAASAQDRTVQNRPYTDLRTFHFGVLVGTHLQDLELVNVGPQTIVNDDGTTQDVLIHADQDRWDPGFTVGVLGELRLGTYFQFRMAPSMYFGTRHITFVNYGDPAQPSASHEERQELKTAYVSLALDLIGAAPRFNNHRPYVLLGLNPMLNLSGRDDDYLRLKRGDVYLEAGLGCDFYLPFFKLRPELKFMYSLSNSLDTNHASQLRNNAMRPYANSVSRARTKIIALTFYFE